MNSYPKMFWIFVAKQVSGWCGSNSKQSLWDTSINNICPNCRVTNEASKHMTHCQNHCRDALLKESVAEVVSHLEKANATISLIEIVETYLLAQGSRSLESCIAIPDPRYIAMAQSHDQLGWDSFVEGCITILWLEVIRPYLQQRSPCKSIEEWGVGFINSLLSLTHKHWIFQNSNVITE